MKNADFYSKSRMLLLLFMFAAGLTAYAQKIPVSGVVKDETGEPVIGASVVEKGTTNGMMTDFDGNFRLSVEPNATLVISYVGYKTQEIAAAGQTNFFVTLEEDATLLQEIVAIGYGTVKKEDATGSVVAIKPEEFNKGLTTNAQDMISGKIAGVNVTSHGGTPGGGATIRIRGGSSLNASNDPLIVIDGLTLDNNGIQGVSNFLTTINPNDIESFTVLKDASATAIYGSRASNGVIIITTKKGQTSTKPTLSYNGNFNVSTIGKYNNVMNAYEFTDYVDRLYADRDEVKNLIERNPAGLPIYNTHWQSEIYQTALGHDHNLNLAGGFKHLPYRLSFGYTNQEGILKTSTFERYTGAVTLNPSLFQDHLKINFNVKGMYTKNRFASTDAVGTAVRMDPTHPVRSNEEPFQTHFGGYWQWATYNKDGSFKSVNGNAPANPVALLDLRNAHSNAYNIISNLEFDYKLHFFPDLRVHLNLATDIAHGQEDTWISQYSFTNMEHGGYDGYTIQDKWNRLLNTYLQYDKVLGDHRIGVMGGYEWQRFHREGRYDGKPLVGNYVYQPEEIKWATHNQLISFFGRLNYSLLDRYLFTATIRRDGSSRFSPGNHWGTFPSFAFAWRMKNENFLADNYTVSDMKLRLGYGMTGQQDVGQDFPYLPVYTLNKSGVLYQFGNTYYPTARPGGYNPNLKWEETATYNAGYDISLFKNRLNASLDYYYRVTNDLLNSAPVSAGTNFTNRVLQNIGQLTNQGVEFMLNAKVISTPDVTWEWDYNITYNQNRITKLTTNAREGSLIPTGGTFQGYVQAHQVGFPSNSYYVYQQVYDNDGKPIEGLFVDRDGDGKITENDKYFYHNAAPDFTMGLASKLIYKNFDFGFSARASIGNYVFNNVQAGGANVGPGGIYSSLGFMANKPMSAFDTNFSEDGDNFMSDYFIQNGSFVKIDNITAGYSFNKIFGGFISGGRLSATVQNPFIFTKYQGLDPEVFGGIDSNVYPRPIMTVIGLTLNF